MLNFLNNYNFLNAALSSFFITFISIPSIIRIAKIKHLFDEPNSRNVHKESIPTLGGVAIFAGLIFSISFWTLPEDFLYIKYILSAVIIIFFIGLKDDIVNLVALKKLTAQLLASFILVYFGDIKITSFYGLYGIYEIPENISLIFSILTITLITNAFNLVDGINLLAGTSGLICTLTFGIWFTITEHNSLAVLSLSLSGSILAFLWYNKTPAKIFMGDTGSLLIGLITSILSIKFIEINRIYGGPFRITSVPAVTIAILIIPLFDSLRVFFIRILQGKNPFGADKNHIHHQLVEIGFSHHKAVALLASINLIYIVAVLWFQKMSGEILLSCIILISVFLSWLLARKTRAVTIKLIESHKVS